MAALIRGRVFSNILFKKVNYINLSFTKCNLSSCLRSNALYQNSNKRIYPFIFRSVTNSAAVSEDIEPTGEGIKNVLEQKLEMLDSDARKRGRIDKQHVLQTLRVAKRSGSITEQQSLMLLRGTGALLCKESPTERQQVFKAVWDTLKDIGVTFTASHYNAALRVKVENGEEFSPTEFLADMESVHQVVPNRITYQLLISRFCELGDVDGASKILEHMKSQGMMINDSVFNAMVKGYMKRGEVEQAKQVIENMRDADLIPTADTYRELLCGYAEKGDMAGIRKVLEEAQSEEVTIYPRQLFDVIFTLVKSGNTEYVDELFNIAKNSGRRYNYDALNCVYQCIAIGNDEMAIHLYNGMQSPTAPPGQEEGENTASLITRALVRTMIAKGRPIKTILGAYSDPETLNKVDYDLISQWCTTYNRLDDARTVYKTMISKGMSVDSNCLWPVIEREAKNKNVDGLISSIELLSQISGHRRETLITVYKRGIQECVKRGISFDTLLPRLKEIDFTDNEISVLEKASLVTEGKFDQFCEEATKELLEEFPLVLLKMEVPEGYKINKDVEAMGRLLKCVSSLTGDVLSDINSGLLISMMNQRLNAEQLQQVLDVWTQQDLKIDSKCEGVVKREMVQKGLDEAVVSEKLGNLITESPSKSTESELSAVDFMNMKLPTLEKTYAEASMGQRTSIEKWLLIKYCGQGNIEKAAEIKQKLDNKGFVYGQDAVRQLGYLAAKYKGDLDEAVKYMEQLESQYPQFDSFSLLAINVAMLKFKAGDTQGGIDTLKQFVEKHPRGLKGERYSEGYILEEPSLAIVRELRANSTPQMTQEVTELLFESGYIKDGTFNMLSNVMGAYIEKDDMDGAIAYMEKCVEKYNRAPNFTELINKLVTVEDANRLQKVVDLLTQLFGERNVLNHLVTSFVECGKVKQARRILETPGIRSVNAILGRDVDRFVAMNKTKELEQLVDVTRNMPGVDRDMMLFGLIRVYARAKESQKVLDVYASYEEENARPRDRTLRYTAKVLQTAGVDVPFTVPAVVERDAEDKQTAELQKQAMAALQAKDTQSFLDIKQKSSGSNLVDSTARTLLRQRRLDEIKMMVHSLAEIGDFESIEQIRKLSLPRNLANFTSQRLFNAYINGNETTTILNQMEQDPSLLSRLISNNSIRLLAEKDTAMFEKLETLIYRSVAEQYSSYLLGHLFNHYCMNDHIGKAELLLSNYPSFKEKIMLLQLTRQLSAAKKEDVLKKLREWFQEGETSRGKLSLVYSSLLMCRCNEGDWQGALEYYTQAQGDGFTVSNLWAKPLLTMESLLQHHGQPVPWPAGSIQQRNSPSEDSETDPNSEQHTNS